ncbi:MAG: phosphodiester glycosidase family protein [Clostridiales bacterium]|nr:phosphodiester glycosidase family protein [Clostridiales bacterium]
MRDSLRLKILTVFAVALLLLVPQQGAVAQQGSLLHASELRLASAARLSSGVYWSLALDDRVTENYIEYIPNDTVQPIIAYGDYIYGGNSLARLTEILEGRGNRVIAAINADYFNMSTVVPLSTVIENGVLKGNEGSSWDSIGFYEDGRARIGRLGLAMSLNVYGQEYIIGKLNKELTAKGQSIQLFSADYADTTRAAVPCVYAVLRVTEGYLGINRSLTAYVESAGTAQGPVNIAPGCLVLALGRDSENEVAKAALSAFAVGQQVTINISGNAAWNDIVYAVGAGERLLTNGVVVAPEFSVSSTTPNEPRTALGVRTDGSFIMYSVDGRQKGYSAGATLYDVAQRLRELGCVEAVNLDGGGSTTLSAAYPGQQGLKTVNRPSGGSLRTCANYILLVNRGDPYGEAQRLHLYPHDSMVLAGASMDITLTATNEDYLPADLPYSYTDYYVDNLSIGTVDENGRFTAGRQPSTGYVYAESGRLSGSARVTVVDRVDSVEILYAASGRSVGQQITLYGGGSVELGMSATYNHLNIIADAASFNWSLSGDIGTIDENGLLTAYNDMDEGEGMLTASLGAVSVSVPVRISNKAELKEDFENFTERDGPGFSLTQNTDKALVRFGNASGALDYDLGLTEENGSLSIPLYLPLTDGPNYLNLWIYGDASDNQLALTVERNGEALELTGLPLDFEGWQYVTMPLPRDITGLISLDILKQGAETGTLYLDQIMSAHGRYADDEPPRIEAVIEEGTLNATVADDMDTELKTANIRLTYDGLPLQFSYDQAAGKLSALLPESDGRSHRLTITARDKSGNVARGSLDIAATEEQPRPFIDMDGHWAADFTTYLYQRGIVNGIAGDKGFSYAPDTNMNRAQFAVIMCNWLGVDTEQYAQTELPFDDVSAIGEWAYPAVQAMYALGITKGSALNGQLFYNPASPISRAEAMTMIGRTLERGYAEAALAFEDSAAVPQWAAPYVRTLVELQVVSGMEGNRLAPFAYVTRAQVAKMLYSLI